MSDEKRPYAKRKRAEGEERTRARIAQAAVDLHGSIGPAFTTITAVAERAGVRRATVYRHFPDEAALFAACSGRWLSQNPLPNIDHLRDIPETRQRLTAALDTVYAYYRPNERILANVIRDAAASPALRATLDGFGAWLGDVEALLLDVLDSSSDDPPLREAAIAHALSFLAWRSICIEQGRTNEMARDLMLRMILAA